MPTQRQFSVDEILDCHSSQLLEPNPDRTDRFGLWDPAERFAAPQLKRVSEGLGNRDRVPQGASTIEQCLEPQRVNGIAVDRKLISGRAGDDRVELARVGQHTPKL